LIVLLPRLPSAAAHLLLRQFLDRGTDRWSGFNSRNLPPAVNFASTGGSRVSPDRMDELRDGIERIARLCGFGTGSSRSQNAKFDADLAKWFAQADILSSGEALRDDFWSFVGVVVAPDIVFWRFGSSSERFTGGIRNAFQRLFLRALALDRGAGASNRWGLLDELTEDALVQITERPSIGSDPILSLAIAEAWLRASNFHGKSKLEPLMRAAVLRIRIRNEVRCISDLPEPEISAALDEAFEIQAGS
jgi:hypothetical protein